MSEGRRNRGSTRPGTASKRLPGDLDAKAQVQRMIRVDHAGEYGAKRIYDGQLAVLRRSPAAPTIHRMAEQERRHLARFERLVPERRVRPTLLQPLWHVAGFALGAATAMLGKRAAMACTVAVEEVIDRHYARQIEALGGTKPISRRCSRSSAATSSSTAIPLWRRAPRRPAPTRSSPPASRRPRASPSGSPSGFNRNGSRNLDLDLDPALTSARSRLR